MSTCDVACVIPTYNRRERVLRALESVYAQTLLPREVIVVDDGSDDGTAAAVSTAFPTATVIRQDNRGVSTARNAGCAHATSQWLAFLDSDDLWLPKKLEAQWAALTREPSYHLCHTDEIWMRKGVRVNPMKKHAKAGGWIYEACLPLCAISPSSVVMRKSVFDGLGGFDESLPACEDYDLWLKFCSRYPVRYLDRKLVMKYGGHADQLSRKYWGMDRFRIRALISILQSGALEGRALAQTAKTLVTKSRIFAEGARKRGREQAARTYDEIVRVWATYEQEAE